MQGVPGSLRVFLGLTLEPGTGSPRRMFEATGGRSAPWNSAPNGEPEADNGGMLPHGKDKTKESLGRERAVRERLLADKTLVTSKDDLPHLTQN